MWPPQSPSCPEARGHTPATAGGHILLTCSPDRTASAQSPGRPHLTGWCFPIWLRPSSWLSQTRPSGLSCFLAASCASAGPTAQPKPLAVPHTRRMLRAQLVCTCCSCNSARPPRPRAPETIPLHLAMQLRPISSLQCWRPPPPTPPCRQRHWLLFARCPDFQVLMTTIKCSPFLMCTGFDILFQEMRNILVTERVLTQTRFLLKSGKYLEIPNCHGSIDASSAKFATILLVHLINRHLTEKKQKQETLSGMWREWAPTFLANSVRAF